MTLQMAIPLVTWTCHYLSAALGALIFTAKERDDIVQVIHIESTPELNLDMGWLFFKESKHHGTRMSLHTPVWDRASVARALLDHVTLGGGLGKPCSHWGLVSTSGLKGYPQPKSQPLIITRRLEPQGLQVEPWVGQSTPMTDCPRHDGTDG